MRAEEKSRNKGKLRPLFFSAEVLATEIYLLYFFTYKPSDFFSI